MTDQHTAETRLYHVTGLNREQASEVAELIARGAVIWVDSKAFPDDGVVIEPEDSDCRLIESQARRITELERDNQRQGDQLKTLVDVNARQWKAGHDAARAAAPPADVESKVSGTYACPICGKDYPHDHNQMVGKFTVESAGVFVDFPNGRYHRATMVELGDEIRRLTNLLERAAQPPSDSLFQIAREISTLDCFYTGTKCPSDCKCLAARAGLAIRPDETGESR